MMEDGPMMLEGEPREVAVSMMTSMMFGAEEPSASSRRFPIVAFHTSTVTCALQFAGNWQFSSRGVHES